MSSAHVYTPGITQVQCRFKHNKRICG